MVKVWNAREATIKAVAAASVTIATGTALDTAFTNASATAITSNIKNVTIVEPELDQEKIDLLGVDGNSFQNAELDPKPPTMAEISGTMVQPGDEVLETFAYGSGTATGGGTHTRYQVGDGNAAEVAMIVTLGDGTDEVNIAFDNAWLTKLGDRKIDSADGHFEQDFKAVCLARDYYLEYKD